MWVGVDSTPRGSGDSSAVAPSTEGRSAGGFILPSLTQSLSHSLTHSVSVSQSVNDNVSLSAVVSQWISVSEL